MIEILNFQFNLIGISITILLLTLLFFKKIDLISILALSSIFVNIPIFNYKPWTFGFQIFYFFSLLLIIFSLIKFMNYLKNKKYLILTLLVSAFIIIVFISLILAYKNNYFEFVIRLPKEPNYPYFGISEFSRFNITQFLYLIFYFLLFLSLTITKVDILKIFKFYLLGLNINLIFQILEAILFFNKKPLFYFLNNLSFANETIQTIYLKDLNIYRFSGLIPSSSMLGIYLTIGLFLILFFEDIFKNQLLKILQVILIILSSILSISSTFILGSLLVLLVYILSKKKYVLLPFVIFLLLLLDYSFDRNTIDIRLQHILYSIVIFLRHPIFGVGYGTHFADFFSSLLSNTGISGFISFFLIFGYLFLLSIYQNKEHICNLMIISLISLFLTGIIWNGINVNILWIILGVWGRELMKNKNA